MFTCSYVTPLNPTEIGPHSPDQNEFCLIPDPIDPESNGNQVWFWLGANPLSNRAKKICDMLNIRKQKPNLYGDSKEKIKQPIHTIISNDYSLEIIKIKYLQYQFS